MEKTYKRVPFDIELAKKIQSGEVEGRIVNEIGADVQIVSLNVENTLGPIAILAHCPDGKDYIYTFYESGVPSRKGVYKLLLELPEETPKQDSFTKKLHDTAEVLATPKHEFKVGDKVTFAGSEKIVEIITIEGECAKLIDPKDTEPIVYDGRLDTLHLVISKPQFKPFDKVLVRNDACPWSCALFSHMSDTDVFPYSAGNFLWKYCIPYEGNESLVGKTDKPKEE